MTNISPHTKGLLTKAYKAYGPHPDLKKAVFNIFVKKMPREQAKHATRKYLEELKA